MKNIRSLVGIILLALVLLASCSPGASPVSNLATAPAAAPARSTSPASNLPPPASQDDAWAKVVQAAKKEGRLTIYSYNMVGDVGIKVSQAFAENYGFKPEIVTGGGAALAEKILTEKRNAMMTADIMDANPLQISNIKAAGTTTSSSEIPVLKERGVWRIEPWLNDAEKHILLHTTLYLTSFANTNVLKSQDFPKSFAELAQPQWKGKMGTWDAAISSGPTNLFLTLLRRKLIDENTLRAIGRNDVRFVASNADASRSLIQGTYALDIETGNITYGQIYASVGTPLPIRPIAMQEGTVFTNNALAAVKDGPHPNAAKVFLNWLLSPEGQNVFVKAQLLTPVRKDVPDFVPSFLQIEPVRAITTTIDDDKENIQLYRDKWLAKLWGR